MYLHKRLAGLVLFLCVTGAAGAACIPGNNPAMIQSELDAGRNAVLCPSTTYNITTPIRLKFNNQQLYTETWPTGSTRAKIRINSPAITNAINGLDKSNIVIRNVIVDGSRPIYGYARPYSEPLIWIGGNASGQQVLTTEAYEPRGWTALQIYHGNFSWNGTSWVGGCSGARIENVYIHDAGDTANKNWADGISLSCLSSHVVGNTIQDATDGGIVIFGSPGSIIEWNTVRNLTRTGIGGINLVDTTYSRTVVVGGVTYTVGDYSNTIVRHNTVEAREAGCRENCGPLLFIGIAMGPRTWWCALPNNIAWAYGGQVVNNQIYGNAMQHGFVADGVLSWTATGNTNNAFFPNYSIPSSCGGSNFLGAFVRHTVHATGTFQSNFVNAQGHHAHPF